ncbi:unnamed protein product [Tetraodon nigroviridis]|uniref:(spotted green pufferfish) hypothetical protein n=1 Tax=Tetraodon nigroviridis TaxID=99883 RepID=Q4SMZ7_TETNG|nr:unnamed protein product [Tetraodon nigroviridis]
MSIEYTIDIQLTELGFPEIVSRNLPGRETGSQSISASQKQKVHQDDAAKETSTVAADAVKPRMPAKWRRRSRLKGGAAAPPLGRPTDPLRRRRRRSPDAEQRRTTPPTTATCPTCVRR